MHTFTEFLHTESFNSAVPYHWKGRTSAGAGPWVASASFQVGDYPYQVVFSTDAASSHTEWSMVFLMDVYEPSMTPAAKMQDSDPFGILHTGHAGTVFATVIAILKEFITHEHPRVIVFTADEPSRQKLYARMMPLVAAQIPGYRGQRVGAKTYRIVKTP